MQSKAKTVKQYLSSLSRDRREAIEVVRKVILKNLSKGYEEIMQYGMIGYVVPLKLFPAGYLNDPKAPLPFAGLASQKNHMAVYLLNIYAEKGLAAWFVKEYKKTGKKLDMGKSCVRFTKLENLPLSLIGQAVKKTSVKQFIQQYEKIRSKH
jgi:hypothetical protein